MIVDDIKVVKRERKLASNAGYVGHRKRLRERFEKSAGTGISNYELIEMLLFFCNKRCDTKEIAKELLHTFKSMHQVFFSSKEELMKVNKIGHSSAHLIMLVKAIMTEILNEKIEKTVILDTLDSVIEYCRMTMGSLKYEQLRILYLNNKNRLISNEVLQEGTINHTSIYPREIIKKALDLGATAFILIHNHPSGDTSPSRQDVMITKSLKELTKKLDIILHDHIIIGRSDFHSMKALNII